MARLIENVVYRARFHNFSCIHHIYKIGYFRHHTQIVRDINNGDAGALLNILNKLQNFCLHCYIQRRGWLVANQKLWPACKRNGYHHTLAHAARKLVRIVFHALFRIFNSNLFQQLYCALVRLCLGRFIMVAHPLHNLFANGHGGVQAGHGVLKHHGNALALNASAHFFGRELYKGFRHFFFPIAVSEFHAAGVHRLIRGTDAHYRFHCDRFARTGFAHNGKRLALKQIQIYPAHGVYHTGRRLERHIKAAYFQNMFSLVHCCGLLTALSSAGQWRPAGRLPAR